MVLLGHNGAGKTTLIHYLLGFYRDISQHPFLPHFKSELDARGVVLGNTAYVPESSHFDPQMRARDYFRLIGGITKAPDVAQRVLMERVALSIDPARPISEYSKGMKQRLALALALVGNPESIVLDEPTSGLDSFGEAVVRELIVDLAKTHRLILSTHSLSLAAALNDEVWVLRQGRIVHIGPSNDEAALRELLLSYPPEQIA